MSSDRYSANDDFDTGFRTDLAAALGQTGFNSRDDSENRNLYEVFGWPRSDLDGWDDKNWLALYLRNAYARVVNDKPVHTTWRAPPEVIPRDGDSDSTFSQQIEQLNRNQRLWSYAERADRAAGIGQHGLLLIDTSDRRDADDWDTDAREANLSGLDDITGYRPIIETQIDEIEYGGPDSERWGRPVRYTIDLSDDVDEETEDDPLGSLTVHWSRVIDIPATRLLDDETLARPRVEPVLNNLLDIEKTLGAAAEAAYRAADYGLHLNADPTQVDFSEGAGDLAEEMQRYEHDFQRYIRTSGVDIERLGGDIQDPSGIIERNLDAISAQTGIPKKELRGNESGEVAGAKQDKLSYFGTIQERRNDYANPHIVRSIVDRHITLGILNRPNGGYLIEWPDLHELSESDRAEIQKSRSSVIANVPGLVGDTALEYLKDGAEAIEIAEEQPSLPAMDESSPQVQEQFEATAGTQSANEDTLDDLDLTPPEAAQDAAQTALDLREETDAMTETGWNRAEQLAAGEELSPADISDGTDGMANWWARHKSHTVTSDGESLKRDKDIPKAEDNSWVAGKGWGGIPGMKWAMRMDKKITDIRGNATRYEEGDPVQTPQGFGVVTEVRMDTFEGKGEQEVDASESSPTYIVALQDARVGVEFYKASQLEETEFPETDVENPLEDVQQTANSVCEFTANGITANQWDPPESWEESETPARVIALDAWASMGGQFNCRGGGCCMGTMRPELGEQGAREFCGSFKDYILGGWEGWRKGG